MKRINMLLGAGIALLVANLPLPAFAQNSIKVGGKDIPVVKELPILIMRNAMGMPAISYTEKSADRRYRLVEVLPTLTQEVQVSQPPAAKSLFRMARVYDKKENKMMTAALPIQFQSMGR
ncbi:hypothetical protein [Kamptonema formosum]|uniref:hypothetical protein n=1 Tax=Kamptonema formosum TaxID=331992 RepID=UPI0012DFD01E|nr:hypothetical protein [Oscillatoria sp. PCC 10802]